MVTTFDRGAILIWDAHAFALEMVEELSGWVAQVLICAWDTVTACRVKDQAWCAFSLLANTAADLTVPFEFTGASLLVASTLAS